MLGMMQRDEVDQRALDGLRGLNAESALSVLAELKGSSLASVSNKSAYMCGIMKSLRQKAASGLLADNTGRPGPNEDKLKVINLPSCVGVLSLINKPTLACRGFGMKEKN